MHLATRALRIETLFDEKLGKVNGFIFTQPIQNILRRILPRNFFFQELGSDEELLKCLQSLHAELPLVKWIAWEEGIGSSTKTISVFLLCLERPEVSKFFYDMISRWLLPGKPLNISLFFSANFKLPDLDDTLYSLSKIVLSFDEDQDMDLIRNNLEIIENEIRLGVYSAFQASRILEIKGLSIDQKRSLIQERISSLVNRRRDDFNYDIFGFMQHFLVRSKEEFKEIRDYEHLTRIIYVLYLFQKALQKQIELFPYTRHLSLKLSKANLNLPFGSKSVLAIFVGVNFLKENEVFEEKHLLKAVRNHMKGISMVEDSFFVSENKEDKVVMLYLELEKENGEEFSLEEMAHLRKVLRSELKSSIEQLVKPIFMPRNEEEVMRHIVTLSNQLKYVKDLPQMIISFDEQTDMELSFTVILLRILLPDTLPVIDLFHRVKTFLKVTPDRIKKVGLLRKKHIKEASVLRVRLPSSGFLREDHSVDLYKARQCVVMELQKIVGEVRDYNGGMISKQIEMLQSLKNMLGELGRKHEFLLENFFHSILPVEMRTVLKAELIKKLFLLLLQIDPQKSGFACLQEDDCSFVMIKTEEALLKGRVLELIEELDLRAPKLITAHFQVFETTYLGFICREEKPTQDLFLARLHQILA